MWVHRDMTLVIGTTLGSIFGKLRVASVTLATASSFDAALAAAALAYCMRPPCPNAMCGAVLYGGQVKQVCGRVEFNLDSLACSCHVYPQGTWSCSSLLGLHVLQTLTMRNWASKRSSST